MARKSSACLIWNVRSIISNFLDVSLEFCNAEPSRMDSRGTYWLIRYDTPRDRVTFAGTAFPVLAYTRKFVTYLRKKSVVITHPMQRRERNDFSLPVERILMNCRSQGRRLLHWQTSKLLNRSEHALPNDRMCYCCTGILAGMEAG
jgi:hypothetical protein